MTVPSLPPWQLGLSAQYLVTCENYKQDKAETSLLTRAAYIIAFSAGALKAGRFMYANRWGSR